MRNRVVILEVTDNAGGAVAAGSEHGIVCFRMYRIAQAQTCTNTDRLPIVLNLDA
jgi:hypothetical protein